MITATSHLHICLGSDEKKPPLELREHPNLPHFLLSIGDGEAQFTLSGPKETIRAVVRDLAALFEGGHECSVCRKWHDKSEAPHG